MSLLQSKCIEELSILKENIEKLEELINKLSFLSKEIEDTTKGIRCKK